MKHPSYLAIARSICEDDAAEDIVSEAFQSIRRKPLNKGMQFCSLMRVTVGRHALDYVRKRERRKKKAERLQVRRPTQQRSALCEELHQLMVELKQACADEYGRGRGDLFVAYNLAEGHGYKQVVAKEFGLTLTAASHRVRRLKRKGIGRFAAAWLNAKGYSAADIHNLLIECKENVDA